VTDRHAPVKPLWEGRFDAAPDPAAFDFGVSFGFDRALFEDDVTGSVAWAEALGAAGVLSKDDVAAIVGALAAILEEGRRNPEWVAGPDEDVHSFVERQLVERIGDAGRRLHTGRRGADAVLHAPAQGAARARRALLPVARGGAAA
jgi:argininosuccinate lyase